MVPEIILIVEDLEHLDKEMVVALVVAATRGQVVVAALVQLD